MDGQSFIVRVRLTRDSQFRRLGSAPLYTEILRMRQGVASSIPQAPETISKAGLRSNRPKTAWFLEISQTAISATRSSQKMLRSLAARQCIGTGSARMR